MSTDTLIVPLSTLPLVSQGRYFTSPIRGIGGMVKSLRQHALDLEEWNHILITGTAP